MHPIPKRKDEIGRCFIETARQTPSSEFPIPASELHDQAIGVNETATTTVTFHIRSPWRWPAWALGAMVPTEFTDRQTLPTFGDYSIHSEIETSDLDSSPRETICALDRRQSLHETRLNLRLIHTVLVEERHKSKIIMHVKINKCRGHGSESD